MASPVGYTMHASGFWFRNSDTSGPYIYDGQTMALASVVNALVMTGTGVVGNSGVVANNVATATLPAVAGKTNYVTGFEVTGSGATVGVSTTANLAGVAGGSIPYVVTAPAGILAAMVPLVVQFNPPLPAAAANTAITLSLPALGLGNLNASVVIHGYQL